MELLDFHLYMGVDTPKYSNPERETPTSTLEESKIDVMGTYRPRTDTGMGDQAVDSCKDDRGRV